MLEAEILCPQAHISTLMTSRTVLEILFSLALVFGFVSDKVLHVYLCCVEKQGGKTCGWQHKDMWEKVVKKSPKLLVLKH